MRLLRTLVPAPIRRRLRLLQGKWAIIRYYGGLRRSPWLATRYLLFDRERDNFTYDISNIDELAVFIGEAVGEDVAVIQGYIDELVQDTELTAELASRLAQRADRNRRMPFGRRLGWYAVARARRPPLVIETGVHDGLGSVALLRALQRNSDEGHPGRLIGMDINPEAGWLVPSWLRDRFTIMTGDALVSLESDVSEGPVGVFIHDSDHRYEHETAELEAVLSRIAPKGILISDNAHAHRAFHDFCDRHGLEALLWREAPRNHFYPGAGIGLAVIRPRDSR